MELKIKEGSKPKKGKNEVIKKEISSGKQEKIEIKNEEGEESGNTFNN